MLSDALTIKTDVSSIVSDVDNNRTDARIVSACDNSQTESTLVVSACDNSPTDCRVVSEIANILSWLQNRVRRRCEGSLLCAGRANRGATIVALCVRCSVHGLVSQTAVDGGDAPKSPSPQT